jgi:hypothetical protein
VRVAYHRRTTFSTANVVKRVLDAGGGEFYSCLFAELAAQMLEFKAQPFDVSAIMICRGDC